MKTTSLLFCTLFISIQTLESQDLFFQPRYSSVDSMLMHCDTMKLNGIIQNDSLTPEYFSGYPQSDRPKIRNSYLAILRDISQISLQPSNKKQEFLEQAMNFEDQYHKQDVGEIANIFFGSFKNSCSVGQVDSALAFFYIARFFRNKYINDGREWLAANADSIEPLLEKGLVEIQAYQQDTSKQTRLTSIDEANKRMNAYQSLDPQSPIRQSFSLDLKNKYIRLQRKLEDFNYSRQVELTSDYKNIHFSIGASAGGQLSLGQPYPLFIEEYTYIYLGEPRVARYTLRFKNQFVTAYLASISISYFLKSNLAVEASYAFSRGVIKPTNVPYNPGDIYNFSPMDNRNITASSFSCIANYYLRVKIGFRPIFGAGLAYSVSEVNGASPVHINFSDFSSAPQKSESIRLVGRGGFEYLPGISSKYSYSILFNISTNLKSNQDVSSIIIEPILRISWLI